jgi:hypothetical protein
MRTPFTVYTRTASTIDEFGSKEVAFVTAGLVVWGYMQGQSAGEVMEKRGMEHERTFSIMFRAQDETNLLPTSRLVGAGLTLEISSVQRYDQRQQTITIIAEVV